jgi:hypothetical protein
MRAKVKTREQLIAEGFKSDYPHWYKGLKKDPEARISWSFVENLAGEEVEILDILNVDRGLLLVEHKERSYQTYAWALDGSPKFALIKQPKSIKINGKSAKYLGTRFDFPCDFSELRTKEAVKLARWVLKVAK